jgi:hypothetical protein
MNPSAGTGREFLRHALATVAYRGGKALRGAPESFATFRIGEATRAPAKLVAHMGDLFDWALSIAKGKQTWKDSEPLPWNQEVERFFASIKAFDDYLATSEPLHGTVEMLFQGPIADALTHVGQLAMLSDRRAENDAADRDASGVFSAAVCGHCRFADFGCAAVLFHFVFVGWVGDFDGVS